MASKGCSLKAQAKINLSLHIEGRRADGYHELSGLVVFADIADQLDFTIGCEVGILEEQQSQWSLKLAGPFADQLQGSSDLTGNNLILKAVRTYLQSGAQPTPGVFALIKNLPIASGMGGGSSDAAATLKILQQLNPSPLPEDELQQLALKLGADVPMCLNPRAQVIGGIGEVSEPVKNFEPLPAVLVNPGVDVETKAVFHELNAPTLPADYVIDNPQLPDVRSCRAVIDWLQSQRNDLQAPALRIAPVIADVIGELAGSQNCQLARMSGSGATCFGLYDSKEAAEQAAERIRAARPEWWVVATMLN